MKDHFIGGPEDLKHNAFFDQTFLTTFQCLGDGWMDFSPETGLSCLLRGLFFLVLLHWWLNTNSIRISLRSFLLYLASRSFYQLIRAPTARFKTLQESFCKRSVVLMFEHIPHWDYMDACHEVPFVFGSMV